MIKKVLKSNSNTTKKDENKNSTFLLNNETNLSQKVSTHSKEPTTVPQGAEQMSKLSKSKTNSKRKNSWMKSEPKSKGSNSKSRNWPFNKRKPTSKNKKSKNNSRWNRNESKKSTARTVTS
jgi:hypothetical protein